MKIAITVGIALVALVIGLAVGYFYRKNAMEKKIGQTEEYAKNLLDEATRKAEEKKKEAVLEAKEVSFDLTNGRLTIDLRNRSGEKIEVSVQLRSQGGEINEK